MTNLIRKPLEPFCVYGYCQGSSRQYTQDDLLGRWSVLFFYPADFTFVCPTELKELGQLHPEFEQEGCQIFSVSEDTHFVHKAWADASDTIRELPFVMLADPAGALARQFGVLIEEEGQALRATFLLNPAGEVVLYEIHDLGIGRSGKELLRKVQAAKFVAEHGDQVCPASWQPGAETLTPSLDLVGLL